MLNSIFTPRLLGLAGAILLAVPAAAAADTVTFDTPGQYTWTVPANVTSARLEVIGGSGGRSGSSCTPGHAGDVQTGSQFAPGDELFIDVGGKGGDAVGNHGGSGGFGGGGDGGTVLAAGPSSAGGGGGGGLSDVTAEQTPIEAFAGGGGGCGGFASAGGGNGGDGGAAGSNGSGGIDGAAGGGDTGHGVGGAGGANAPADSNRGAPGGIASGGNGYGSDLFLAGGGGGGAGWENGGGGGAAASNDGSGGGGGGGTSLMFDVIGNIGTAPTLGDGSVTITYTPEPAPTVTTGAASSIIDTAATLGGTVNPEGLLTKYHFEYGMTSSYGQQTVDAIASNTAPTAVLAGLKPGTLYHYRIVASNASGTVDGADATFKTPGPPAATTGTPGALSDTAAALTGAVNPDGHDTTYHFEVGTTTAYGLQTPDASAGAGVVDQQVRATLTGLVSGTVYHYRLVATNASGTTDGPDQTLRTAAPPSTAGQPQPQPQPQPQSPSPSPSQPGTASGVPSGSGARVVRSAVVSLLGMPRVTRQSVVVTVACAVADCRVGAMLTTHVAGRHALVIGSARDVLRAGSRRTITIALSAAGRRLQSGRVRVPVTLSLSLAGQGRTARVVAARQLALG